MAEEKTTARKRAQRAPSTVEDDQVSSGQTNVDSPQETAPEPEQPRHRRYVVDRAHDGREIGQELELEPDGHTTAMVTLGHLREA